MKKVICILIALVLCSGCSQNPGQIAATAQPSPQPPVVVHTPAGAPSEQITPASTPEPTDKGTDKNGNAMFGAQELYIAGIRIGDKIEQVRRKHGLRDMREEEIKYSLFLDKPIPSENLHYYTNNDGLFIVTTGLDEVIYVKLTKGGYDNTDDIKVDDQIDQELSSGAYRGYLADKRLVYYADAAYLLANLATGRDGQTLSRSLELIGFYEFAWQEAINGQGETIRLIGSANPVKQIIAGYAVNETNRPVKLTAQKDGNETLSAEWLLSVPILDIGFPQIDATGDVDGDGHDDVLIRVRILDSGESYTEPTEEREEESIHPNEYTLVFGGKQMVLPHYSRPDKNEWDLGWFIEKQGAKALLVNKMLRDNNPSYLYTYCTIDNGKLNILRKESVTIRS